MDLNRKNAINEQIDNLSQNVLNSECDTAVKSLLSETVNVIRFVNENVEIAHGRLDDRKSEFAEILNEFKEIQISQKEQSDECRKMVEYCKKIVDSNKVQIAEIKRNSRRHTLFTAILIGLSIISMFGAVKGATVASSIWNVVKVFIP